MHSPSATAERRRLARVDRTARAALKGQRACVVWLTGLSGAGKSTIGTVLEGQLHALGHHTMLLDGDDLRRTLCKDLGFTPQARSENVRRVAQVARLMTEAGLIVVVTLISPYRLDRLAARQQMPEDEFVEVFVDTPPAVAEARDPKGLYAKARQGLIPNFTGIDAPYERPERPEMTIDTTLVSADEAATRIIDHLSRQGVLSPPPEGSAAG